MATRRRLEHPLRDVFGLGVADGRRDAEVVESGFGDFFAGVFEGPVAEGGDTGCEEDGGMVWGFAGEVDQVAHAGDVGLE